MEILTAKTVFAAAARGHWLPISISLIALEVALAVIIGIAVAEALRAGSLRRAVGAVHSHNFGYDSSIDTIVHVWY
jgi:hypothetical protein